MKTAKSKMKTINLGDIDIAKSPKIRLCQDAEAVADYTKAYRKKKGLPPIVVAEGAPGKFILADGHHRVEAARAAGLKKIEAEVIPGGYEAAFLYALSANATNGVRRTNADKHHAIEIAYNKFPRASSRAIAEMCAVDDGTVAKVRRLINAQKKRDQAAEVSEATKTPSGDAIQQPAPSATPEPEETVIGIDTRHYPARRRPKGILPEEWVAQNSSIERRQPGENPAADQSLNIKDFIVLVRDAAMKVAPDDRKHVPEKLRSLADQLEIPTSQVVVSE
jgi:ParB-like chromosome segregation protein Spo0J